MGLAMPPGRRRGAAPPCLPIRAVPLVAVWASPFVTEGKGRPDIMFPVTTQDGLHDNERPFTAHGKDSAQIRFAATSMGFSCCLALGKPKIAARNPDKNRGYGGWSGIGTIQYGRSVTVWYWY